MGDKKKPTEKTTSTHPQHAVLLNAGNRIKIPSQRNTHPLILTCALANQRGRSTTVTYFSRASAFKRRAELALQFSSRDGPLAYQSDED